MKKSLENLLEKQGIALLNTLSKEERRARTETIKARYREAGYDDLPHFSYPIRRQGYQAPRRLYGFYILTKPPYSPRDAIL